MTTDPTDISRIDSDDLYEVDDPTPTDFAAAEAIARATPASKLPGPILPGASHRNQHGTEVLRHEADDPPVPTGSAAVEAIPRATPAVKPSGPNPFGAPDRNQHGAGASRRNRHGTGASRRNQYDAGASRRNQHSAEASGHEADDPTTPAVSAAAEAIPSGTPASKLPGLIPPGASCRNQYGAEASRHEADGMPPMQISDQMQEVIRTLGPSRAPVDKSMDRPAVSERPAGQVSYRDSYRRHDHVLGGCVAALLVAGAFAATLSGVTGTDQASPRPRPLPTRSAPPAGPTAPVAIIDSHPDASMAQDAAARVQAVAVTAVISPDAGSPIVAARDRSMREGPRTPGGVLAVDAGPTARPTVEQVAAEEAVDQAFGGLATERSRLDRDPGDPSAAPRLVALLPHTLSVIADARRLGVPLTPRAASSGPTEPLGCRLAFAAGEVINPERRDADPQSALNVGINNARRQIRRYARDINQGCTTRSVNVPEGK